MAKVTYDKEITALLVIDPYNDFISEGGKFYFHAVDKGGHFAAWEQPELFSAELRAALVGERGTSSDELLAAVNYSNPSFGMRLDWIPQPLVE